jgi:uncharacterized membrane protein YbaN (DUF454 family)
MNGDRGPEEWSDFSHQVQPSTRPSVRYLLMALGVLFTVVGIIGIFLPLVPTTPLLLLAASCFARASATFYNALLNHRVLGPPIRRWRETRSITRRSKVLAILMIVLTFGISIVGFIPVTAGKLVMAAVGTGLIVYLAKLPTDPKPRVSIYRKR